MILAIAICAFATGCFDNGPGRGPRKGAKAATFGATERRTTTTTTIPGVGAGGAFGDASEVQVGAAFMQRNWTYHGAKFFENLLAQELNITGSGRSPATELAIIRQIRDRAADLGTSNYASGVYEGLHPEAGKFRFITEISNEACYTGLQDPVIMSRMFPGVTSTSSWTEESFKDIYFRVAGRGPISLEKQILLRLAREIPAGGTPAYLKQAAAVCATVLSSLDANNAR